MSRISKNRTSSITVLVILLALAGICGLASYVLLPTIESLKAQDTEIAYASEENLGEDKGVTTSEGTHYEISCAAPNVAIQVVDYDSQMASAPGNTTLKGAYFRVDFYEGLFETEQDCTRAQVDTRTWTFTTDSRGQVAFDQTHQISGDELFADTSGNVILPGGTYIITLIKVPTGYMSTTQSWLRIVSESEDRTNIQQFDPLIGTDQVKLVACRNDAKFTLDLDVNHTAGKGIPFLVLSQTTGEAHVIDTDDLGLWDSSAMNILHSYQTNANDTAVTGYEIILKTDRTYSADTTDASVDEAKLQIAAGTWFQGGSSSTNDPTDNRGAFPYDTYEFIELPCSSNNYQPTARFTLTITLNNQPIDLGNVTQTAVG